MKKGNGGPHPTACGGHLPHRGKAFGDIPLKAPEDAAAVIRTAFGLKGWQIRMRGGFRVSEVVAALWVAARECGGRGTTGDGRTGARPYGGNGEVRLREVLRWARQMEGKR